MGETCIYRCFLKWWYPQVIHFNRVFHDKPSILGYLYCWWTKSCTTKDDHYPNIYSVSTIPGGAGFLPSTVFLETPIYLFILASFTASGGAFGHTFWTARWTQGLRGKEDIINFLRMYCNSKTCVCITYIYMYIYIYMYVYSIYTVYTYIYWTYL